MAALAIAQYYVFFIANFKCRTVHYEDSEALINAKYKLLKFQQIHASRKKKKGDVRMLSRHASKLAKQEATKTAPSQRKKKKGERKLEPACGWTYAPKRALKYNSVLFHRPNYWKL